MIRRTFSLCPECMARVPAYLERRAGEGAFLCKECPEHGAYASPVWRDLFDLDKWISREEPMGEDSCCTGDCRNCSAHPQGSCCVILEVTKDCDLACAYCFAHGGESSGMPSFEELCRNIDDIADKGGGPLIQFSGGEPTLRDDLPGLIRYAREAGCQYTQINTNGIRLACDEDYVRRLADAGLDIVFLQFDGIDDEVYRKLRGRALLRTKLDAVAACDRYGIGVTLVPTIVRGVNDRQLGDIVRLAAGLFPAVRSVHFQPVTYLGRYPGDVPEKDNNNKRMTLDELMAGLCEQAGIPENALLPSRCDHAMCEFHSTFLVNGSGQLEPLTDFEGDTRCCPTSAEDNRRYVAEHWRRGKRDVCCCDEGPVSMDEFLDRVRTRRFKISAMAFQDAANIDLERLARCSLHVYEDGRLLPFCAKYLGLKRGDII